MHLITFFSNTRGTIYELCHERRLATDQRAIQTDQLVTMTLTLAIFVILVGVFASAIVVPEPVPRFITHYDFYYNTSFSNGRVMNASIKLTALKKTVPCLSTFLQSFMNNNLKGVSTLLIETKPGTCQIYLSKIEDERPVFLLANRAEYLESVTYQKTTSEALIIAENHKANVSNTLEEFKIEADQVVDTMWKKNLANIVILGTVKKRLYATKSVQFRRGELRKPKNPTNVKYCDNSKDWNSPEIFPELDLNNSTIKIGFFNKMPYSAVLMKDGKPKVEGLEIGILLIARKVLNLHMLAYEVQCTGNNTVDDEVTEEFKSDKNVDVVIGGILWDPYGPVDFTLPYDVAQILWVIPKLSNVSLKGLVSPLDDQVWMAVASVLLFGIFLRFTIFRSTSLLEIFALILSTGWYKQPKKHSVRLYFISWVLFGFLLAQFYLASMAGQLMAHADIQMNTMAELVESNFKLGGTITHKKMFDLVDDGVDDTNVINQISKKFIVFTDDEYSKQWNDLISGVNQSVALVRTMNSSALGRSYSHNYVHTMSEVIASYPLAFAVWQGLPYLSQLDRVIQMLIQGGIVNYLGRRYGDGKAAFINDSSSDNLELDDLAPAFLILVMGYLASGLCFLAELVTAWLIFRECNFCPMLDGCF